MGDEEIIVDLSGYLDRCRCCLEDFKSLEGQEYFELTPLVFERYLDFTSSALMSSPKLSKKICLACHSLLARHSALKTTFVQNQQRLEGLLEVEEALKEVNVKHENEAKPHSENAENEQYTFIESIEEFDEAEWDNKDPEPELHGEVIEEIVVSPPDFSFPKPMDLTSKSKKSTKTDKKSKAPKKPKKKPESHICEFCSKQFDLKSTFNRHVSRHYNYNSFICDICGSRSHSKADLNKHLFTHLRNDPRVVFRCQHENCQAVYRNRKSLTHHINAFHGKARPHKCHLCTKSFALRYMLTDHIRFFHQGQRPVLCDVEGCEGRFTIKGHLQRHKRKVHKIAI